MDTQKDIDITVDMIRGNINRMCVTDDEEELIRMQQVAKKRIDDLYTVNRQRLKQRPRLIEAERALAEVAGVDFDSL